MVMISSTLSRSSLSCHQYSCALNYLSLSNRNALSISSIKLNSSRPNKNAIFTDKSLKYRVYATADGGRNFQDDFKRKSDDVLKSVSESILSMLDAVKTKASDFERENDIKGKFKQTLNSASSKYEEISDDVRRQAQRINREYHVSDRFKEMMDATAEKFRYTDEQLGLGRKFRSAKSDFKANWPRYQKSITTFMATPLGKFLTAVFFSYLLLSGLLFQFLFWGIWLFPFIPPLLRRFAQDQIVQGVCPSCGSTFVGSKNSTLTCKKCRGIVWQTRKDFSNNGSPIIDIEAE